jgi:phospho-2-dehydro-3-deoxyheptonate aldolase
MIRQLTNMTTQNIENINVTAFDTMPTPEEIHARLPISDKAAKTVTHGRNLLRKILDRKDPACLSLSARAPSTTRSPASITPAA